MVKHSLDKVSGHKHFFGKHVQQLVVDGQVSLHAKLRHLPQGSVDKLHVATAPLVPLDEDVHHFVECSLVFDFSGHLLKNVCFGCQRLVLLLVLVDGLCGDWLTLSTCWTAVQTPQHLEVTIYFGYTHCELWEYLFFYTTGNLGEIRGYIYLFLVLLVVLVGNNAVLWF